MLAALPDAVVGLSGLKERLYRLPVNLLAETPIYSIRRPPLSRCSLAEEVISVVKEQIARMNGVSICPPRGA